MLLRVVRHEIRVLAAGRALWITLALLALALAYGASSGATFAARREAMAAEAVALRQAELARLEALLRQGATPPRSAEDPASPLHVGGGVQYVALPRAPLAALAIGQSDVHPPLAGVSILSRQRTEADKLDLESPVSLPLGRLDLAFALVYLWPLLLLALSYDLLARDRESGVLRMLLAHPVPLPTLVLGKALARAAVAVLPALALPAAWLAASGALGAAGAIAALALWAAVVAAYGAFWLALAVAVNALGKTSATSALALAGVFCAAVIVLPGLAGAAVSLLHPPPSRALLINAVRDDSLDARRDGSRLLARYYEDHPELRPAGEGGDDFGKLMLTTQIELERRRRPIEARFQERLAAQQALVDRLRFVSPAILAQEAMSDLAGTGTRRHAMFRAQVEAYADAWRAHFIPLALGGRRLAPDDYARLPPFTFREEPLRALALRIVLSLVGIAAPTLALALFAAARLRRSRLIAPPA
ncbi:DUF3526 domain-containing protein [Sorangium cellulosum]|uniref:ABC transporter permease n=1 Tax=Sorangium cellulosum So0157-2 TaxID=1254432 RepID=S4XMU7_SORCE|nr:DUF3526 domain-containing protein [Sorangium cellulosum]AGP34492.1 hypothetical protein SCE1572_08220 [Sorangium cellulosum So0157-2]